MSLRASRLGRPGVIECPIALSVTMAGSAAVIARGVERRQDRIVELATESERPRPGEPTRTTARSTDP